MNTDPRRGEQNLLQRVYRQQRQAELMGRPPKVRLVPAPSRQTRSYGSACPGVLALSLFYGQREGHPERGGD